MGGFSPNTYSRIVNFDADGWLGAMYGFENLGKSLKTIKDIANKANKDPNNFKVILLTLPNIIDSKSKPTNEGQRFPLTGTIDQTGSDIQKIKSMGVDRIIFGYNFVPIGRGVSEMIDTSKQLSKFART